MNLREPDVNDGQRMWELAKDSTIDLNSSYSYLMMAEYFSDSCVVAEKDNQIIGFITGFLLKNTPDTIFIWQVVVDPSFKSEGAAQKMISWLIDKTETHYVQATITPTNRASINLFYKIAAEHLADMTTDKEFFSEDDFPDAIEHESEMLVTIGPIEKNASNSHVSSVG